jgi:hypothetical protein
MVLVTTAFAENRIVEISAVIPTCGDGRSYLTPPIVTEKCCFSVPENAGAFVQLPALAIRPLMSCK